MENSTVLATRTSENRQVADSDNFMDTVGHSFDKAFARSGTNKKSVCTTFEATLDGLKKAKDPEARLRTIAKSAALATGRCHDNVVETCKFILDSIDDLSSKHGFKSDLAKDQLLLGLAEGACQLGPVVYCRFLDVANSYKDEADEWITRNRRLPVLFEDLTLPVIVPYESTLTITPLTVPAENVEKAENVESPLIPETREKSNWSRPKQRSIFRRLTEAVGHFFGG